MWSFLGSILLFYELWEWVVCSRKKKIDLKKKIKIKIKFKTYFCTTMVVIDAYVLFFIECRVLKFMEEKPH